MSNFWLNQLLGMPLFLFAALLPVSMAAAFVLRAARVDLRSALEIVAAAFLFGAIAGQLLYALLYLGSPTFTDHIEPNTAAVAWLFSQGGQIYHAIDAPERCAFV